MQIERHFTKAGQKDAAYAPIAFKTCDVVMKNPDGSTFRSFTLDSASNPTSRT